MKTSADVILQGHNNCSSPTKSVDNLLSASMRMALLCVHKTLERHLQSCAPPRLISWKWGNLSPSKPPTGFSHLALLRIVSPVYSSLGSKHKTYQWCQHWTTFAESNNVIYSTQIEQRVLSNAKVTVLTSELDKLQFTFTESISLGKVRPLISKEDLLSCKTCETSLMKMKRQDSKLQNKGKNQPWRWIIPIKKVMYNKDLRRAKGSAESHLIFWVMEEIISSPWKCSCSSAQRHHHEAKSQFDNRLCSPVG